MSTPSDENFTDFENFLFLSAVFLAIRLLCCYINRNSFPTPTRGKSRRTMTMKHAPLSVYFAGDLFDAKDLGGNLLLAAKIEELSQGKYTLLLPQDGECEVACRTSENIRDTDFELLFNCDILVANFDGPDPDSGTVAEFCFAKMVDMPAVLLRTDFRNGGDASLPDGDPWNLMCSHYPRTASLHINAMALYHELGVGSARQKLSGFYTAIASRVVEALEQVTAMPSWIAREELFRCCQNAIRSIGPSLEKRFPQEKLLELIRKKSSSGLF